MTKSEDKTVPMQETAVEVEQEKGKRGRPAGSIKWTHPAIMARSTEFGIMDNAFVRFLHKTYGIKITREVRRAVILSHHSAVRTAWTESDQYKAARADSAALIAEQEKRAAIEAARKVTSSIDVATLAASLSPEQLAALAAILGQK